VDWGFTLSAGPAQCVWNPSEQPWAIGYDLRVGWDLRLHRDWRLGVTAGLRRFFDDTTTASTIKLPSPSKKSAHVWDNTIFNLNVRRLFVPTSRIRPYLLAGFGVTNWRVEDYSSGQILRVPEEDGTPTDFKSTELHTTLGAGIEYEISPTVSFRSGFDFFYLTGVGTSFAQSVIDFRTRGNLVFNAGLTVYFGGKQKTPPTDEPLIEQPATIEVEQETRLLPAKVDADGDGVPDSTDLCPDTPSSIPVDSYGCPRDSDGDGVLDLDDQCDSTVAGAFVDSLGCPVDSDDDGVFDGLDFCPHTPPAWRLDVDKHGCVIDSDSDGIPDFLDDCPDSAPDAPVDSNGCVPDEDRDGVLDKLDLCPGTPAGLAVDESGCLIMTQLNRTLLLFPDFEPGLVVLDRVSRAILDDLAVRLSISTQVKVYIRAYTDNIGEAEANRVISQRRADRARQYLIDRGIAPERITGIGLGEVDFIADNATAAGRKRNRRLEITYER